MWGSLHTKPTPPGGEDTLEISGWGCAAGSLEPLAYTRAFWQPMKDRFMENVNQSHSKNLLQR